MKSIDLTVNKRIIPAILLGLALLAGPAGAHTGGFTYEATVNNYFVDIGASKIDLVSNELTLFEFNLYPNTDPNNLADFDNVYVTVGDGNAVQFSTFVHRPQGMLTVLSYSFPKSGSYEMSARFQKDNIQLAEVSFRVEVGERSEKASENSIKIAIFSAIAVAAVVAAVIMRRKGAGPSVPPVDR